jgi:rhamnulose-1-phosphate aldolase
MSHSQEFLNSEHLTQVLWSMIPETLAFAPLGIGVVPYALPSSVELVEPTLSLIEKYDVVLWEKHGTVAFGPDMMEAFDQTDVLNKAANIYMTAKNFGFTAEGMTPEAVQKIRDVFNLPDKR